MDVSHDCVRNEPFTACLAEVVLLLWWVSLNLFYGAMVGKALKFRVTQSYHHMEEA